MKGVSEFLGCEYRQNYNEPTVEGQGFNGNSSFSGNKGGLYASSLEKWRGQLDEKELYLIEKRLAPFLKQHNYSFTERSLSLGREFKVFLGYQREVSGKPSWATPSENGSSV